MTPTARPRGKPHLNVGTIGHLGHGKTTLTAALVARQAHKNGIEKFKDYLAIAEGEVNYRRTLEPGQVEYETAGRRYAHFDCPGHPDYLTDALRGIALMDGAILVVAADDGPMPQTREHLLYARLAGVSQLVVFLGKKDLVSDPDLLDLIELEVRELLTFFEFPGDEVPIVLGNASAALWAKGEDDEACACIDELLHALDASLRVPQRSNEGPFLLSVDDVFSIFGRGTAVTGRSERGRARVGEEVEVVGLRSSPPRKAVVAGIETFNRPLEHATAGDYVGLLLHGLMRHDVERGMAVVQPGSVTTHSKFEANLSLLSKEEGGRHTPIRSGFRPQFYFRTADVAGTITLPHGVTSCFPGERTTVTVELSPSAALLLHDGQPFFVREGYRANGHGTIRKPLD
jgi:elongation factor Tu